MLIGLHQSIQKIEALTKETKNETAVSVKKDSIQQKKKKLTKAELDTIINNVDKQMDGFVIPTPKKAKEKVIQKIKEKAKDTIKTKKNNDNFTFQFGDDSRLDKFVKYVQVNPDTKIDPALDSLKYEKNFTNRFLFTRAKAIYSFAKSEETREEKLNQLLSYGSVALFILLPIFTIFLKFFYIRRKYTYVDHLVFVFHIQTVFFMLFSIYFLFLIFKFKPGVWVFFTLFLLYLFIALKKFYQQGYFKTFFKFILLNISYGFVATIGAGLIVSLALMIL
ncbi:hypothetical protein [Polaribacter aquimarinus]|uniref:hypothetical protein n=1 Tax=Polaribacter aquimarinus TaxID=2100726 RepID=UPI001F23B70E|nr:hypothetical protein [Polaribacter aquimarinus]